ncbi:D-3-phosphoglycerate dehydrogenase [Actinidia rufa]|uniref:phosphoglycerate dehydrogenase n=1 Tax=Actinidia rufa TaxID=165716 RepID=A0A7J0EJC4_9ERIC|nr:D-3-phosphoglycerate dehydrogenase [Actinidia rufa]
MNCAKRAQVGLVRIVNVACGGHLMYSLNPKDSMLVLHENVTASPYLGASTIEAQEGVAIEIAEAVVGALKGELAASAVNAPMVPAEVLSELAPFVLLAEKLGKLTMQLVAGGSGMQSVKITYASCRGQDDLNTRLLCAMITKGMIEPISSVFVNLVNTDFTAKWRGLKITEERIVLDGSPEKPLERVTPPDGLPHLTMVGSFGVDVSLEGHLTLCEQVDKPGIIGKVGSILGVRNMNVNFMIVGRIAPQKHAVMTIGVDGEPDTESLKQIGEIQAIEEFCFP